jgi:hypothetical protein
MKRFILCVAVLSLGLGTMVRERVEADNAPIPVQSTVSPRLKPARPVWAYDMQTGGHQQFAGSNYTMPVGFDVDVHPVGDMPLSVKPWPYADAPVRERPY